MNVVKDGGKVITVSGDRLQAKRNITVRQMQHHPETHHKVKELVSDIANGKIRIVVDQVYHFDEALDALKKTETRHGRGKLVVSLLSG